MLGVCQKSEVMCTYILHSAQLRRICPKLCHKQPQRNDIAGLNFMNKKAPPSVISEDGDKAQGTDGGGDSVSTCRESPTIGAGS